MLDRVIWIALRIGFRQGHALKTMQVLGDFPDVRPLGLSKRFDAVGEGAAGHTLVFECLAAKDKGDTKLDSLNLYRYSPA